MISRFIILSLVSLLVLPACGQSPEAQANAAAPGSVWVVESATTRLYLCGTIHLLRKTDHPLPNVYEQAYADSQRLVFELPPQKGREAELATKMQAAGNFPDGEALSDKIKDEAWQALNGWAKDRGLNAGTFNTMRPWFVALIISATEYAALGADPERGVDRVFEKRAEKDGKPGEGLETVDFQIGLFTALSELQQQELLEQTLAEAKSLSQQFEEMIASWRAGDAEALHQMLFKEAEKYPDLLDRFLTQRNARWIAQLERYLAGREHVMVLVGGGHMGGKGGVIDLLQGKGYTVRKLSEQVGKASK
jgi:hypothetical protein